MISVTGRKWQENKIDNRLIDKIQQEYNFPRILSKLIVSRNFDDDEIYLIENRLKLTNIFKDIPDFINSVKLVEKSIKNKENICILGDYDVDGSSAASLLINFFKKLNHPYFYYIPDRFKDGYGASKKLFKKLILKKPKLVIMVDCGSTNVDAIDYLNNNNIRSLIIDHHEINKPFPKANIIINPKKDNGYNKYDYLCATTLTYFFLELLSKKIQSKINLRKYLIYVLLATVCDVMPIRKLNRLIAIVALKEFKNDDNQIFNEIYKINKKQNKINITDLAYLIGPILNSGGRLGKSNYATELLTADNYDVISQKTLVLNNLNNKRKKIETKILDDIDFKKLQKNENNIIIYYNSNINEGLIGIIAARLKDHFNKPAVVITSSNSILKGSARSVDNYNIGKLIKKSLDNNLVSNGGGHSMAAGFSLKKENLLKFKKFINQDYAKNKISISDSFTYDAEISSYAFNKNFYNDIKKIGPFGTENPTPTFLFRDLKVIKTKTHNDKHISCLLKTKIGFSINSISFNSFDKEIGNYLLNYKKNFNVIGQITENFWNNKRSLQLLINDLIL